MLTNIQLSLPSLLSECRPLALWSCLSDVGSCSESATSSLDSIIGHTPLLSSSALFHTYVKLHDTAANSWRYDLAGNRYETVEPASKLARIPVTLLVSVVYARKLARDHRALLRLQDLSLKLLYKICLWPWLTCDEPQHQDSVFIVFSLNFKHV